MLIEFSVGNYRSFKEQVTLSMVAANLVSKEKTLDENNLFIVDEELKLLKSTAIYGANASGKSNIGKALSFMKWFMVNSSKDTQSGEDIAIEPFKLSTETEDQPSHFELVFLMDDQKYRYGFKVNQKRVISEWLFYVPNKRETNLFKRELDSITTSKKYNAEGIAQKTRNNALFLSVSAQFNVDIAEKILAWVTNKMNIISGLHDNYLGFTVKCLVNDENKTDIIQLIKKLDLGIEEIQIEQKDFSIDELSDVLPDELKKLISKTTRGKTNTIVTKHRKYDEEGNPKLSEQFDMRTQESDGTQKLFALAEPLLNTLKEGEILVIDEFDVSLHPLISRAIVNLFNSSQTNSHNAQLIFMTHDTNLLSNKILRRDQIWFTEKNRYGATDLYSLVEYKVRNDSSFESDYIKGKYGAIPYLGDLSHLLD